MKSWPKRILVWTYDGGLGEQFRACVPRTRALPGERVYVLVPIRKRGKKKPGKSK